MYRTQVKEKAKKVATPKTKVFLAKSILKSRTKARVTHNRLNLKDIGTSRQVEQMYPRRSLGKGIPKMAL